MVLESRLRKLTHTHTHTFSFHEHSLKSVCQIMGLLAISEKTIVFEVESPRRGEGKPCVLLRVVHGYGSVGPGIFDSLDSRQNGNSHCVSFRRSEHNENKIRKFSSGS